MARVPSPVAVVRRLPFPYRAPHVPRGVEPPPPRHVTGSRYDTEWARRYPARLARLALLEGLARPTMKVLAAPERRGLDRLDELTGPVIFAANHHSHIDTPLMLTSIPEQWRHRIFVGAAADYFFRNRATSAVSALVMGAIPIERSRVSRRSADQAAELIQDGWSMLIFPEGGRSPDGWGQPFRGGAAYLSIRCGVPVIPVHLRSTGRVLAKGDSVPRPARTRVTFGTPIWPEEGEDARRLAARLEHTVAALGDEARSDWWQARRRAHAGHTPGLTGPEVGTWRRAWARSDRRRRKTTDEPRWPDF